MCVPSSLSLLGHRCQWRVRSPSRTPPPPLSHATTTRDDCLRYDAPTLLGFLQDWAARSGGALTLLPDPDGASVAVQVAAAAAASGSASNPLSLPLADPAVIAVSKELQRLGAAVMAALPAAERHKYSAPGITMPSQIHTAAAAVAAQLTGSASVQLLANATASKSVLAVVQTPRAGGTVRVPVALGGSSTINGTTTLVVVPSADCTCV
jgi:hypothetical protein